MIAWPAMLRYAGQDELDYIADIAHWQRLVAAQALHLHADDQLIDSEGVRYRPQASGELQRLEGRLHLQEAITLLQRHEVAAGQCCVAKFSADSIAACISLLD
ncbi:MAG TPA: DUF4144 family protein [Methylophilaceae bacterium]|nr:DUF4144 family protein [Methylophilaceae bacterium]